jgi:hypothetical protein
VSSRTDPSSGNKGEILFTGAGDIDECDSDVDDFFLKYDFLFSRCCDCGYSYNADLLLIVEGILADFLAEGIVRKLLTLGNCDD